MFLRNEILVFAPGRRSEALDRLNWIHGLMAPKPGFRQAIVAKYLGDETRHTILRMWNNEDDYRRFRETPDGSYGRSRPAGIYLSEPVVPQWSSVLDLRGSGQGDYLVKVQQAVAYATWPAVLEYQARLGEILLSLGNIVHLWVFRAQDRSESLSVIRLRDRAAFDELLESSDFATTFEAAPQDLGTPSTQCFEVVSDIRPT